MTKVFISYSSEDRAFAQRVREALASAGIGAYLDTEELPPGTDVASAIRNEVRSADAVVVILSDKAIFQREIQFEIGMAQGLGKPVVAVVAPGSSPDLSLVTSLADTYVLDADRLKGPELGARINNALGADQTGAGTRAP
jgi:hypothetical protein